MVLGLTQGTHVFGGRGLRETPRVSVHKQEKGLYGDVWWGTSGWGQRKTLCM